MCNEVPILLTKQRLKYYLDKGIVPDHLKVGNIYNIPVNKLAPCSSDDVMVEYKCDYCGLKSGEIRYRVYNLRKSNALYINKDVCNSNACIYKRKIDNWTYMQNNGLLKLGVEGYWFFRENRLKELKHYLEKNIKDIDKDKIKLQGDREINLIRRAFRRHNEWITDALIELGYSYKNLFLVERGYFNIYDNFEREIRNFINNYGFFPKLDNIVNDIGISSSILYYHIDSIQSLKEKMKYRDTYELIDKTGYRNKSVYEFITAQLLIYNNLLTTKEQRDVKVFPNREIKSDFKLNVEKNNKDIHIEIWGRDKEDKTEFGVRYNEQRKRKEELYNKHSIKNHLISIEAKQIFNGKAISKSVKELAYFLSNELNITILPFDNIEFIKDLYPVTNERIGPTRAS